jgi:hypothetical protein
MRQCIGSYPPTHRVDRVATAAFGIYSIMMENLAQTGGGGGRGCTPIPFHYIYHHEQSYVVRSSSEGRYTPPISTLPLYVLCAHVHTTD